MSEIVVRPARADELPAVGRLTVEAYVANGYLSAGDPYAAKLADAARRAREAELLVAADARDFLLGTVTVVPPGSPWAQVAAPDELEFRMLAVEATARGRGVGAVLTRAVLDRAAELGLRAVVLASTTEMTAAHRLYERLGFRRTPERDLRLPPALVLITYRLDLSPARP